MNITFALGVMTTITFAAGQWVIEEQKAYFYNWLNVFTHVEGLKDLQYQPFEGPLMYNLMIFALMLASFALGGILRK